MLVRCFVAAFVLGLAVGLLAALGSGSTNDPFAAMGMLGAYVMILAAIAGGLLLALALALSADPGSATRKNDHTQNGRTR